MRLALKTEWALVRPLAVIHGRRRRRCSRCRRERQHLRRRRGGRCGHWWRRRRRRGVVDKHGVFKHARVMRVRDRRKRSVHGSSGACLTYIYMLEIPLSQHLWSRREQKRGTYCAEVVCEREIRIAVHTVVDFLRDWRRWRRWRDGTLSWRRSGRWGGRW